MLLHSLEESLEWGSGSHSAREEMTQRASTGIRTFVLGAQNHKGSVHFLKDAVIIFQVLSLYEEQAAPASNHFTQAARQGKLYLLYDKTDPYICDIC